MTLPAVAYHEALERNTSSGWRAEKCLAMDCGKPLTLVNSFLTQSAADAWCAGSIAVEVRAQVAPVQVSWLHPG